MKTLSKKPGGAKEKIRNEAIKLFKEYGYENVTVVQICEAAGITKRTFYYHFSAKDEIVDGIVGHVGHNTEQMADALLHQETNVGVLWAMRRNDAVDADECGAVITAQVDINILQRGATEVFPDDMVLFNASVRTITNAQMTGEIGNQQPPKDIAFALFHALRSAAYSWCAAGGSYPLLEEYKRIFISVLDFRIPPEKAFGEDS